MTKTFIPAPPLQEMLEFCYKCVERSGLYLGKDDRFYLSGKAMSMKDVRGMLTHDLHTRYFITSKTRADTIEKFFEQVFTEKLDNRQTVG
jgi:hypothetical protein